MEERQLLNIAEDALTQGALRVGEGFTEPDDDWAPILVSVDEDGQVQIIGGWNWRSMEERHQMLEAAVPFARQHHARAVGLLTSAWMRKAEEKDGVYVVDSASREEVVQITLVGRTMLRWVHALIERDEGSPPRLGDWDCGDTSDPGFHLGGDIPPILKRMVGARRGDVGGLG